MHPKLENATININLFHELKIIKAEREVTARITVEKEEQILVAFSEAFMMF